MYLDKHEKQCIIDLIHKTRPDDENQVFGLALELERWSHHLMAEIIRETEPNMEKKI